MEVTRIPVNVEILGLLPVEIDVEVAVTDDLPLQFAGRCVGPTRVELRPAYRNDAGLLAHELEHVRQWWRNPLHPLLYRQSRGYRRWSETDAYRAQDRTDEGRHTGELAARLASFYGLGMRTEEALMLIRQRD